MRCRSNGVSRNTIVRSHLLRVYHLICYKDPLMYRVRTDTRGIVLYVVMNSINKCVTESVQYCRYSISVR